MLITLENTGFLFLRKSLVLCDTGLYWSWFPVSLVMWLFSKLFNVYEAKLFLDLEHIHCTTWESHIWRNLTVLLGSEWCWAYWAEYRISVPINEHTKIVLSESWCKCFGSSLRCEMWYEVISNTISEAWETALEWCDWQHFFGKLFPLKWIFYFCLLLFIF